MRQHFRSLSVLAVALLAFFVVGVGDASAVQTHLYTGITFGPEGTSGDAIFDQVGGIAVDGGSGHVYVYDNSSGKVYKFNPDGSPADFSALSGNAIEGLPGGTPNEVQIAVAPPGSLGGTDGDIYVATGRAVKIFSPSGALLGELTGPEPCGVAVGPDGRVLVNNFPGRISEYLPSENPAADSDKGGTSPPMSRPSCLVGADGLGNIYVPEFGAGPVYRLEGVMDSEASDIGREAATLTVDLGTNDLYTTAFDRHATASARNSVTQYDSAGNQISSFGTGILKGAHGVAVSPLSGEVYVSTLTTDGGSGYVTVFGPLVTLPDAITRPPGEVGETAATLNGVVNPQGTDTTYQFEYGETTDYDIKVPVPAAVLNPDSEDHQVSVALTGLEPGTSYHYRVAATNEFSTTYGEDEVVIPGDLGVETTGSPERTATTVRFDSRIFSRGNETTYHFEYGEAGSCDANPCTATEPRSAGSKYGIALVSQVVEDLTPGATYHYRVIADDGGPGSPVVGSDLTVTTKATDEVPSQGQLPGPPESDRAWEQVSLPDSGGNPVGGLGSHSFGFFTSGNGERTIFLMRGGAPGGETGSLKSLVYSERTSDGWQVRQIAPPRSELNGGDWTGIAATADLSTVLAANSDFVFGSASIWRMSPSAAPSRLFESQPNTGPGETRLTTAELHGVSADGSRIIVDIEGDVDPDYPGLIGRGIYDVTTGAPDLVSVLPGGQPCPEAQTERGLAAETNWLSADGDDVLFFCEESLFARNMDSGVTRSLSGDCEINKAKVTDYLIKSVDGVVYFGSRSALTSDDSTPPGATCGNRDIYRGELDDGSVECVTCSLGPNVEVLYGEGDPRERMALSADGSQLYFQNEGRLLPGASSSGLYDLDLGDRSLTYVGPAGGIPALETTPDGSVLLFTSGNSGYNAAGGQDNGGTSQTYRYDRSDRSLVCISCAPGGATPGGDVFVPVIQSEAPSISADGSTIGFVTPSALTPADQNSASPGQVPEVGDDVYEWRDGRRSLVTDGLTEWPTKPRDDGGIEVLPPVLGGIAANGRDLFFFAAKQYTADALDSYRRLYDARIGGGFVIPPAPKPCALEVCQGTPKGEPQEPLPGTPTFKGSGNVKKTHAKRHKQKHHRKAKHKKRHQKKHHSRTRHSNDNRRTVR